MFIQDIIIKKRNKQELSKEEIDFFIKSVTDSSTCDSQIGAFTMAVCINSMSPEEIKNLTFAMRDSGDVLKWNLDGPIVDKHSSGGVGDKISLMLAPMMASIGAYVPMISGRGLGHTGGTLDKFDSIPGYNTAPDNELFEKVVKEVGCAIIGQTGNLAPADKKIYSIRDVSGTVESIPLITASILSKKLSAGLDCLVMDLKCGNGAFMQSYEDAKSLADSIVKVGNLAGTKTDALITDMNSVLGRNVGNALEVKEAVEYLQGKNINTRMHKINMDLCTRLAEMSHLDASKLQENLDNGKALENFAKMVSALGGPKDFIENMDSYLPKAKIIKPVFAKTEGLVKGMKTREIGMLLIKLKGGRSTPEDKLDYATGFSEFCQVGDKINKETPLCYIHAQSQDDYNFVSEELIKLIELS
ncbi:MAG: thymidine phosphorylase [Alphaproteobacteria bacterium]